MSKGGSGHFKATRGAKKAFSKYPKIVHPGRQEKHIPNSNNYIEGKSVFAGTKKYAEELIKQYSGSGHPIGDNKERVDFGKVIGYYVDEATGGRYPTTVGIIHYSNSGAHIVPARPKD